MQEQKYIQEDEIDLREIFKSIFERKYFILIFTLMSHLQIIKNNL